MKTNQFKKHLAEKEAKDYNDLKYITIAMLCLGLLMCVGFTYVLIKL